jgi:hypothetical protein
VKYEWEKDKNSTIWKAEQNACGTNYLFIYQLIVLLSRHKLFPNIKYCVQTTQKMNQTFKKYYYLRKCGIQQNRTRESSSQKGINSSTPVVTYTLQNLIMPDECGFFIVCNLQKPTHSKKKVSKS